jgi:hypothetical protein
MSRNETYAGLIEHLEVVLNDALASAGQLGKVQWVLSSMELGAAITDPEATFQRAFDRVVTPILDDIIALTERIEGGIDQTALEAIGYDAEPFDGDRVRDTVTEHFWHDVDHNVNLAVNHLKADIEEFALEQQFSLDSLPQDWVE